MTRCQFQGKNLIRNVAFASHKSVLRYCVKTRHQSAGVKKTTGLVLLSSNVMMLVTSVLPNRDDVFNREQPVVRATTAS